MKCVVIILTFLNISYLSSGLNASDKDDAASMRGKRTLYYRKKTLPVLTQPRFDYNLYPKYYPIPNVLPYNDPEVAMGRRSNPLHVLDPSRVISTEHFETSKASVNLDPGYMNGNEYETVRYIPDDALALLTELVKSLMMNNDRQIRGKKPAHNDVIYSKHILNNVPQNPQHQIIDQSIPLIKNKIPELPVITVKELKETKLVTKTKLLSDPKKSEKENPTNETTVLHPRSDFNDSDDAPSTTTTEYNDQTSTELASTTESTYTTTNQMEEVEFEKDLLDVNTDNEDFDNQQELEELDSANETLSVNNANINESHHDESFNDNFNVASESSEERDKKDDILINTNQIMEAVKSEVAKQLGLVLELLSTNKFSNIDNIEEEKPENLKNSSNIAGKDRGSYRDKDGETCSQNKEKMKSVFTNFEGNEHFANFFLFYPNRDVFDLKLNDKLSEKSGVNNKQKNGSLVKNESNNKEKGKLSYKKDSVKETDYLKVSVNKRNEKDDSDTDRKDFNDNRKTTNTVSSLEGDVNNSVKNSYSENGDTYIITVDTDDSDDINDNISGLNDSTVVKRSPTF